MSLVSRIVSGASSLASGFKKNHFDPLVSRAKSAYLRYAPSVVYGTAAASLTAASLYLHHYQDDASSPLALPMATVGYCAASVLSLKAGKALKEELAIRANNQVLKALETDMNQAAPEDAPLVVIFHCESDHNGAFDPDKAAFRSLKGVCKVAIIPITGPHEIEAHLERISQKTLINHLVLSGHGSEKTILFRTDRLLHSSIGRLTEAALTPAMFQKVDPKGTIILPSCETGGHRGIASQIAKIAPQKVQAPYISAFRDLTWIIMEPDNKMTLLALSERFGVISNTYRGEESALIFSSGYNELDLPKLEQIALANQNGALLTYVALSHLDNGDAKEAQRCLQACDQRCCLPSGMEEPVLKMQAQIQQQLNASDSDSD